MTPCIKKWSPYIKKCSTYIKMFNTYLKDVLCIGKLRKHTKIKNKNIMRKPKPEGNQERKK